MFSYGGQDGVSTHQEERQEPRSKLQLLTTVLPWQGSLRGMVEDSPKRVDESIDYGIRRRALFHRLQLTIPRVVIHCPIEASDFFRVVIPQPTFSTLYGIQRPTRWI